ncbi:hypothetical protein DERF_007817 [Dermatophagoides farinae]|uniref:Uncharacterized protein n=1 Tax=Dermatophagoides farinae TaxID=6954 RepID=A0A922L411_DERFA|nr:hypothetical protein DERF_007817 [Dermatophagoides farinae]
MDIFGHDANDHHHHHHFPGVMQVTVKSSSVRFIFVCCALWHNKIYVSVSIAPMIMTSELFCRSVTIL